MCDPLIGGLIAGAGALITGSQAASQQQAVVDAQNQANQQWVAYQNQIHKEQAVAEDEARQRAETARENTLQQVSPQNQQQQQQTEQQRLNALYGAPGKEPYSDTSKPSSLALSGEQTGNQTFSDSLTSAVNNATTLARNRIAALATAGSYGGSFGGLGTTVPIEFAQGGNAIQLQNDIRQGNLKTYGVEQQVQPINYAIGPGTEAMGSIAKSLGGMAGSLVSSGITRGGGWSGITNAFSGTPVITDGSTASWS